MALTDFDYAEPRQKANGLSDFPSTRQAPSTRPGFGGHLNGAARNDGGTESSPSASVRPQQAGAAPGAAVHRRRDRVADASPAAGSDRLDKSDRTLAFAVIFASIAIGLLIFNAGRHWAADDDLFAAPVSCYSPPDWVRCP